MTYEEIKNKLTKCEKKLKELQASSSRPKNYEQSVSKLNILKESLEKQLKEAEKGIVYTDDEEKAKDLADDGTNVKLTKESEFQGKYQFDINETKAIAKKVGKAVAIAVKELSSDVKHMKAVNIKPDSFNIRIIFKNDSDEEFKFFIEEDTLHLTDFSYDKELVGVGVKPDGEAIVHIEHLANELIKVLKDKMYEGMSDQEFADAKEKDRLEKHPDKEKIKAIQALIRNANKNEGYADYEPGTIAPKDLYYSDKHGKLVAMDDVDDKYHDRLELVYRKGDEIEGPMDEGEYAAGKGQLNVYGYQTKHFDICPGAVSLFKRILKEKDKDEDDVKDLAIHHDYLFLLEKIALDMEVSDRYDNIKAVLKRTGKEGKFRRDKFLEKAKGVADDIYQLGDKLGLDPNHRGEDLSYIQGHIEKINDALRDEEVNEAPDNEYYIKVSGNDKASQNALQDAMETWHYPFRFTDIEDDRKDNYVTFYFNKKDWNPGMKDDIEGNGVDIIDTNIPDFHEDSSDVADTDYMQRRRAEKDYQQESALGFSDIEKLGSKAASDIDISVRRDPNYTFGKRPGDDDRLRYKYAKQLGYLEENEEDDLDVGHQDDEPSMLKSTAYESATYAAKLYKKLAKYDQFDGEVDFPNWWQSKLILAKDYLSKAFHYLDSEEKQPMIDKLALEGTVKERLAKRNRDGSKNEFAPGGKYFLPDDGYMAAKLRAEDGYFNPRNDTDASGDTAEDDAEFAIKNQMGVKDPEKIKKFIDGWMKYNQEVLDGTTKLVQPEPDPNRFFQKKRRSNPGKHNRYDKKTNALIQKLKAKRGVNEGSYDEAIDELRHIVDQAEDLGQEAREVVRQYFPDELSRLDGYQAFNFVYSNNRYDTTLGKFVDRLEEEGYEELEEAELTDKERKELKDMSKSLKGSSKGHGQQAKYLDKLVKEREGNNYPDFTDMATLDNGMLYVDDENMDTGEPTKPGSIVAIDGSLYVVTNIEKGDNYLVVKAPNSGSNLEEGQAAIKKQLDKIDQALKQHKDKTIAIVRKDVKQRTEDEKAHIAKMADLTKKKKDLLDKYGDAVAGINRGQELDA